MRRVVFLVAMALTACTASGEDTPTAQSIDAEPIATNSNDRQLAEPSAEFPKPQHYPPAESRDLDDRISGCPHMNPTERPRGSNCHGIFPEQCGADRAARYVDQLATPDVRKEIVSYSPTGDVRFINPNDAVIEDLRFGRLNVLLDANNRITKVDCY